jgi:hypothetical protein
MRNPALLFVPVALCLSAVPVRAETDPLAELAQLGDSVADSAQEGGGSIRAKREVDLTRDRRLKDPRNLEARVESVKTGTFPAVALRLKVLKAAKEGPGQSFKASDVLVVVPRLVVEGGKVVLTDPTTVQNAGAYYLVEGDKVVLRLGARSGRTWQAEYLERK